MHAENLFLCSVLVATPAGMGSQTLIPLDVQTVSPQLGWRLIFLLAFALFVGNAMKVCCRLFIKAQCFLPLYQAD